MSVVRARNARLLRRLVLTPTPEMVESFDAASPIEIVQTVLDARPSSMEHSELNTESDHWAPTKWWLTRMADPGAGLDERLVWFWHGHLTSGLDKSGPAPMNRQLALLRRHARGDFRELLREITLDPAMLRWLDGSGSDVEAPNENYARELMELFALGRDSGAYTEADVSAGAKALAGYWVNENDGSELTVEFEPEGALRRPVRFLGAQVSDVDGVIDTVCDRAECAEHVAAAMFEHFIGGQLDPGTRRRLADTFRSSNLNVDTLVRRLLTEPAFLDGPALRPRSALEWFLSFQQLVSAPIEMWALESMGQAPLNPPNVAGWPGTERWASAGMTLNKGQIAVDHSWDTDTLDRNDPVTDLLRRAVLYEVSPQTRAVLDELAAAAPSRRDQSSMLHAAIAMSPEFSLI
ncbi:MAG: DUF1800 family protein [Ilumatobacter sp.]